MVDAGHWDSELGLRFSEVKPPGLSPGSAHRSCGPEVAKVVPHLAAKLDSIRVTQALKA